MLLLAAINPHGVKQIILPFTFASQTDLLQNLSEFIPSLQSSKRWLFVGAVLGLLAALAAPNRRAVVLSAQRTRRGWEDYLDQCAEAAQHVPGAPERRGVIEPYYDDPGFIAGNVARIKEALTEAGWSRERFVAATLILTAHAIPVPAEKTSPYREHVTTTARLVAEAAGHPDHLLGFQSAPDESRVPWSTPRLEDLVDQAVAAGAKDIVVQSVGFLVDHVEVIFDLDEEVANQCRELGVGYLRARCVHDQADFIAALADRVLALGSD